ncbi:MAG: GntR family transcriptional regulator [Pseudomonadota bacterium]
MEHLRQAVLDGVFAPGSRINEVHLSRDLNLSRTPVRAALQMLAGEGLLNHLPNRGFTVREVRLSEIVEAYEMRALAEGLAARLAAEQGLSDATRRTIEEALAAGDRALSDGDAREERRAAYSRTNRMFHHAILDAGGSQLVRDVVRLCQRIPQASAHNVVAFDLADVRRRHEEHHAIYAALLDRDVGAAEALMRAHVASVELSMIRTLSRRGRQG